MAIVCQTIKLTLVVLLAVAVQKSSAKVDCDVPNCKRCTGNSGKCAECDVGYELTSTETCRPVVVTCTAPNCKTCVSGSSTICSECNDGYYVSSGTCLPKCQNDPNCGKCYRQTGQCQYCKRGYEYNPTTNACNEKTDACHAFCLTSSGCTVKGAGKCDGAYQQGYVNFEDTCRACDANCDPIQGSCDTPGTCKVKCIEGYTLIGSSCRPCSPKCVSGCDTAGEYLCDSACEDGYTLHPNKSICLPCDENCDPTVGCDENGVAKCDGQCVSGYTYVASRKRCLPCDKNCVGSCDTNGPAYCDDTCAAGYVLNSTKHICLQCARNCDPSIGCNTSGAYKCDGQCNSNYYFDSAKQACYPCDKHCSDASGCDSSGPGNCDSACETGYELESNHCYKI